MSDGLRLLRNLDLALLAAALPVFVAADLPMLGFAGAAAAWLGARAVERLAERRALASGDRRTAMGAMAASLFGRLYLVGLTILAVGLIDRKAGLAAALLSVSLFTVHFTTLLVAKPMEEARR